MHIMSWAPPLLLLDYGDTLLTSLSAHRLRITLLLLKGLMRHRNPDSFSGWRVTNRTIGLIKVILPDDALHIRSCGEFIQEFGPRQSPRDRVAQAYRRAMPHEVKRVDACQSTFPMRATRTQVTC